MTRWLRRGYDWGLVRVRQYPGRIVLVSALLGAAALGVLPFLGGGFLPEFREGVLIAEVTAWPGTSLEETTRLAGRLTSQLREEIPHVAVRVGRASLDEDAAPVHRMEVDLVLPPDAGDPEETADRLKERMRQVPGIRFSVEGFLGERINELLSGERAPIAVKLYGSDLATLRRSAARLMEQLARIEGVESVRSGDLVDVPTIDVDIDEERLALVGAQRGKVVEAAAAWRQGLPATEVKVQGGFSVPIVIASPDFEERDRLEDLPVFTASSTVLPLSFLASLNDDIEPPAIDHEGGRRLVTVTVRTETAKLSTVADQIERAVRSQLGPGTDWELAGQAAERETASVRLLVIATLVLTAVFAFLWMAFGSVVDAAAVLGGVPLGMVGGVVAALLLPEGLSMASLVGFVALSGVIGRNGIMLVTHKNQLMAETPNASVEERILQAARERLLPIVMTAATAFFGLLPLAASVGAAGSELESPMALIVCGGLLSSTALNLVAVPSFFVWRHRRRRPQESGQ